MTQRRIRTNDKGVGSKYRGERLPGASEHESDRGTASGISRAGDDEPVSFVEGNRSRIRSFEVCRHVSCVDALEAMLQQSSAQALTLMSRVNPQPGKVPMRERRMRPIHLAEGQRGISLPV